MSALLSRRYTVLYLLLNLGLGVFFIAGAEQYPEGPALFPTILGWGLVGVVVVHSSIELGKTRRRDVVPAPTDTNEEGIEGQRGNRRTIVTLIILSVFILTVPYIGLYVSSAGFLFIALPLVGQKKWYLILGTIIAVLAGIYLVFDYALGVPLPSGALF